MRTPSILFLPLAVALLAPSGCLLAVAGVVEASKSSSHVDPFGEEVENKDGAVGWRATLDHDHELFTDFAQGAHRLGCGTRVEDGQLGATCPGNVAIFGYQDGRMVTRMCAPGVDRATCKDVWERVQAATPPL